jgi:hypothetical protein
MQSKKFTMRNDKPADPSKIMNNILSKLLGSILGTILELKC